MDYVLMILAFLATLIAIHGETWKAKEKGVRKITIAGYITILIAASVLCISIVKTNRDAKKLNISDLHITLYAENLGSYQPNDVILANAPEAFTVDYAFINNFVTRLDFSSVRDVARPSGYRAPDRATLVYHSVNFRKALLVRDTDPPFNYLWDLNGKKLSFRIPTHKFTPIQEASTQTKKEIKWKFRAELIINNKIFEQEADEEGKIEFTIEGM